MRLHNVLNKLLVCHNAVFFQQRLLLKNFKQNLSWVKQVKKLNFLVKFTQYNLMVSFTNLLYKTKRVEDLKNLTVNQNKKR